LSPCAVFLTTSEATHPSVASGCHALVPTSYVSAIVFGWRRKGRYGDAGDAVLMRTSRGAEGSSGGVLEKWAADTTTGDWDAADAPKGKTFIKIKKTASLGGEVRPRPVQTRRWGVVGSREQMRREEVVGDAMALVEVACTGALPSGASQKGTGEKNPRRDRAIATTPAARFTGGLARTGWDFRRRCIAAVDHCIEKHGAQASHRGRPPSSLAPIGADLSSRRMARMGTGREALHTSNRGRPFLFATGGRWHTDARVRSCPVPSKISMSHPFLPLLVRASVRGRRGLILLPFPEGRVGRAVTMRLTAYRGPEALVNDGTKTAPR